MPSLRRVPRIYHLRDTAANARPRSSNPSLLDSSTPSDSALPPPPHSFAAQPGPSRYRLRSSRLVSSSRIPRAPPHSSSPSRRRVAQHRSSPILRMPAEILYRIGQFLEPGIDLEDWCEPGRDLLHYSSACTTFHYATASLIGRHFGITINDSPSRTFRHALERLKLLTRQETASRKVRKLFIKDDLPLQSGSQQARMEWHCQLGAAIMAQLPNIELFAYVRDLDQAVRDSPYDTTPLGLEVIHGLAHAPRLRTLYLGGVHMTCWSHGPRIYRPILPSSLAVLQLLAVHDSMLPVIKLCKGLKTLRIWRDFMVPHHDIEAWLDVEIWSKLEELQISGFYGNEVAQLQVGLRESRRKLSESHKTPIPLHTLVLDEPYTVNDVLGLLCEFSSREMRVLRLTCWRDGNFKPAVLERLAELFPELEELQVTLETIQCRWWPHKVNAWALSLSRMTKLQIFRWNCIPFVSPDSEQVRVAMRSQAIILAHALPNLHTIGFVDREDYLTITRYNGRLNSVRWTGLGRSSSSDLVTDRDLGLVKSGVGPDPFLAPPGYHPSALSLASRCLSSDSSSSTSLGSLTKTDDSFGSTSSQR